MKPNTLLFAGLFLLGLLGLTCACSSGDFEQLGSNACYVAVDTIDRVICIDHVDGREVSGRWYVAGKGMSEPHAFHIKGGLGSKSLLVSDSTEQDVVVEMDHDTLLVKFSRGGTHESLRFAPLSVMPSSVVETSYPYRDKLYRVACDSNLVYATALGFWESFPEPDDENDYRSIVMEKLNLEDLTKKDLKLTMDVYYPENDDFKSRPLLMLIHGGAFFNGDKRSEAFVKWSEHFASMGYVVANINYRIGFLPITPYNVDRAGYCAVQDAYAAMCYMLRHAEQYKINPDWLFVGGSSAGAITALNLAFMRNWNRLKCTYGYLLDVLNFFYDLGDIETVNANTAPYDRTTFNIKAVVNMWGALHDVKMLDNSKHTAILSFHGDADSIVAYDYDYPFRKLSTPICVFVDSVADIVSARAPEYADLMRKAQDWTKDVRIPANQYLCGKMYGSQCIDQYARGSRISELHTKVGGGHSLHVNDDGSLSDYFQLITDTSTRFLYRQIAPRPELVRLSEEYYFKLKNADHTQTCQWEAVGGVVMQSAFDSARVLFFAEAPEHKIRVCGQLKNGANYAETYDLAEIEVQGQAESMEFHDSPFYQNYRKTNHQ